MREEEDEAVGQGDRAVGAVVGVALHDGREGNRCAHGDAKVGSSSPELEIQRTRD